MGAKPGRLVRQADAHERAAVALGAVDEGRRQGPGARELAQARDGGVGRRDERVIDVDTHAAVVGREVDLTVVAGEAGVA